MQWSLVTLGLQGAPLLVHSEGNPQRKPHTFVDNSAIINHSKSYGNNHSLTNYYTNCIFFAKVVIGLAGGTWILYLKEACR